MYKIIIVLLFFCLCRADEDKNLDIVQKLGEVNDRWLQATLMPEVAMVLNHPPYSYHLKGLSANENVSIPGKRSNGPLKSEHSTPQELKCNDDLLQLLLDYKSDWALHMLDSDGKLSSGILRGGLIWPGHFDECKSVYSPKDDEGRGGFSGQYCITSWNTNLAEKYPNQPLTVGLCVPDSCTAKDIKELLRFTDLVPDLKKISDFANLTDVTCKSNERKMDTSSIIYLVFVSIFIILVVTGSALSYITSQQCDTSNPSEIAELNANHIHGTYGTVEINSNDKNYTPIQPGSETAAENEKTALTLNESPESGMPVIACRPGKINKVDSIPRRILMCFSAFENGEKILNTDVTEGQLLSVHGVRFLSLTWVILGHTYITPINMISNRLDVLDQMDSFPFQVLLQSPFSVDAFFLLSGFLCAYLFLKEADKKNGKINWIYFYVHRFWRLTPAYLVVVFFYMYVFKYMGSGPFWEDNHCDDSHGSWWMYVLYINNFIPIHQMCVGWSWYLANDMQFYFISPLFLYPLWKWPKIGFGILTTLLLTTWTITGVLSYKYELIPMFVGATQAKDFKAYSEKMWDSFNLIYDKPYCRIAPYIIGVFLGYMLYKNNQKKNFLTWWQQLLGWTIAAFFSLSVIYGLYHVNMSRVTSLFYNSLCRSAFTIGLAWVIFVCETGHGGFITKLLSWKLFIPLSRLTYCAYLVHPILIHAYYFAYPTAIFFTQFITVTNFMGFMIMSYGIAFLFSLTFESPLMNLEKLLLKSKSK